MPTFRTQGPLGQQPEPDPASRGAVPSQFGKHAPTNLRARQTTAGGLPSGAGTTRVALVRRTQGPAAVPVLRIGSAGNEVRKLQALLNIRLSPSPALRVDGSFGALTAAALTQTQRAASIRADGIAGKDTWRVLGSGQVFAFAPSGRLPAAVPIVGSTAAAEPSPSVSVTVGTPVRIDDVLGWPAERKFLDVSRRAIDLLPCATRDELLKMISPASVGITLALWAASHLVGAGEVIDLALFGLGVIMIGSAVIGVMEELGHFLVKTHNAANQEDLDEAAAMLAHVIVVIGVTALVALLSKIRLKGRAAGGQGAAAAEAEAANAPRGGAARPSEKSRPPVAEEPAPATQRSTKPADKAGSACETAGCPISMVTGEEMLDIEDFTWQGPLGFVWRRFYRSGHSDRDGLLGHGWLTPLDESLAVGSRVTLANADGQHIDLPLPPLGGFSVNLPEKLHLHRERGLFRLVGESGPERLFEGHNGHCRLIGWQMRGGPRIDVVRDAGAKVTGLMSNWGRSLKFEYSNGRIVAISPGRRVGAGFESTGDPHVRYEYSAAGDLVATLGRLGQGERYRYEGHLLVQRTLVSGFGLRFKWDGSGPNARCLRNWGDGGNYDYKFEWLPGGISHATDSRGGVTIYEHNAKAQLLRKVSPEGRETRYTYNEQNLRESEVDAAANTTRFKYNEFGHLVAVTDPLGHRHRIERDDEGRALALTDPLGNRWSRRYDAHGRLTETREPNGAVTRYAYNTQGLLASITDATDRTRRLLWDEQMRLVGDIGFDGVRRRYQYDADDRITGAVTQDKLSTRYEYDAAGQLTAVHAPDGRSTRLGYNAAGLLTRYTDGAGNTTEYRYADGLSQVTSRIDALGQVMRYEYDLERNLVALENAKGERYQLGYDRDENLVEECGFDGRVQRYEYGRAGHLLRHIAGGSADRLTEFERDRMGRLLSKRLSDVSTASFAYDPCGRLVRAVAGASTVELQYDAAGRIVRELQDGRAVASEYDLLGRRTSLTTPSGQRLSFRHDDSGRLAAIDLDGEVLSEHRYDEYGREVARTQGSLATTFEHDPMGRLVRQHAARKDTAVLGRRYGYDEAGRVASIDDLRSGASHYVYDPVDRLVQVQGLTPERFVHDPAGNLLGDSPQGGLVKGDRLLMQGDRHYAYDDAGNLVEQRSGKGGHAVTRYGYDGDNRLTIAETAQGRVEFGYDALGRRTFKHSVHGDTRFVYDGVHLLGESSGGANRTYVFEPNSFRPVAVVDEAEGALRKVSHYHLDHLGTPRELTDADGRIVWSARYRAYGALALAEVNEVANPLRFPGQYHDAETGLHYNLNRYYDPTVGRFIHQDPIGLLGGANVYQYAPNPSNWVDPMGLTGECPKATKEGGSLTEPDLPPKTIVKQDGVEIVHYTKSGDHGPAHLHVKGGGAETRIGQAGKPIDGAPELTPTQQSVVTDNKSAIRKAVDQIQRWFRFNER